MFHVDVDEIFDFSLKFAEGKDFNEIEIKKMIHIRQCKDCYEKFCVGVTLCDSTTDNGIRMVANERRSEPVLRPLSVINVLRNKVDILRTAVMEQMNNIHSELNFEPTYAMATRGQNASSDTVKLVEIDDERTFIVLDSKRDELYCQINIRNLQYKNVGIYLMFENNNIIEVPVSIDGFLAKGYINNIPEGNFKLYIDSNEKI